MKWIDWGHSSCAEITPSPCKSQKALQESFVFVMRKGREEGNLPEGNPGMKGKAGVRGKFEKAIFRDDGEGGGKFFFPRNWV